MAGCSQGLLGLFLLFHVSPLFLPHLTSAAAAPAFCPRPALPFLSHLGSQCPRLIELSPPKEARFFLTLERICSCLLPTRLCISVQKVTGNTFEELTSREQNYYCSVLFYATWCPFSHKTRPTFDALSSMFPQIKHLLVEESSDDPSVLSRNSIHSFPAIMLINGTTRFRYHGSKNITSLVNFYKESTGLEPIIQPEIDQASHGNAKIHGLQFDSAREFVVKEPYLAFGMLFMCLRIIVCSLPVIFSRVKAFWVSHSCHLNLRFLRESSQLLEQVLHVVDVKRWWSNLKLSNKTRKFRKGANNARAWASSIASVSLGDSSSTN